MLDIKTFKSALEQLEEERKSAENKEKALASSLQESKRMSSYLKQITNALTKERKKAIIVRMVDVILSAGGMF